MPSEARGQQPRGSGRLLHSGATLEANGGWYMLALFMAVSGALPKEVAVFAGMSALVLMGNALFRPETTLFGLCWPHGLFCASLAVATHFLGQESEVKVYRCTSCYWRGPATDVRFGRCPKCRQHSLKDENITVLTSA